jgi:hypothetical protein
MEQKIRHADCQSMVDEKVYDLVMLDPPFDEWDKVTKIPKGKTYICFTNFQNRHHVQALLGNPKFEMIWHFKDGRWVSNKMPRHTHEHILIYGDLRHDAFTGEYNDNQKPINKGKGSIGRDTDLGDRTYHPKERKMLNSVIEVPRNVGKTLGVWGKPIDLILPIMEWLTDEGEWVWDGFAGSGTFGCVAKALNLNYIGYEIKIGVAAEARERLREYEVRLKGIPTLFQDW